MSFMRWYITNKYTKIYFNIIKNAKNKDYKTYTEWHHIRPKSLGGSDDESNLVRVSMREHFVLHKLLPKITEGEARKKMISARWFMSSIEFKNVKYSVTSREYELYKTEWMMYKRDDGNYAKIIKLLDSGSRRPNETEPLYHSVMYFLRTDEKFRKEVSTKNPSWLVHIPRSGRPQGKTPHLDGEVFGELLVMSAMENGHYLCKCSCGKILSVRKHNLFRQNSCGHNNAAHLVQLNKNKMYETFYKVKADLISDKNVDLTEVKKLLKSRSLPKLLKEELYTLAPHLRPRGCGSNNRMNELIAYVKSKDTKKLTTNDNLYYAFIRFLKTDPEFFKLVDEYKPEWITRTLRNRIK